MAKAASIAAAERASTYLTLVDYRTTRLGQKSGKICEFSKFAGAFAGVYGGLE